MTRPKISFTNFGLQESCMKYFKLLASQEVLHLLQIFAVSLKEAKMTFLIPERITFLSSSLGFKDAVYKILSS